MSRIGKAWDLSWLKDKKLTFHSFIDAGQTHETPESEMKDFIAHDAEQSVHFMCTSVPPSLQVPWGAR
jgi:hypothetical protein